MILQFAVLISPFSMTELALPVAQTTFRYILNFRSPNAADVVLIGLADDGHRREALVDFASVPVGFASVPGF
jgi:hypothetical protein